MTTITQTHVRMNDYVGPGIYATITWQGPCPKRDNGSHLLGLLGPSCVCCGERPKVEYEK